MYEFPIKMTRLPSKTFFGVWSGSSGAVVPGSSVSEGRGSVGFSGSVTSDPGSSVDPAGSSAVVPIGASVSPEVLQEAIFPIIKGKHRRRARIRLNVFFIKKQPFFFYYTY